MADETETERPKRKDWRTECRRLERKIVRLEAEHAIARSAFDSALKEYARDAQGARHHAQVWTLGIRSVERAAHAMRRTIRVCELLGAGPAPQDVVEDYFGHLRSQFESLLKEFEIVIGETNSNALERIGKGSP
jgi:hypothetical protein